MKARQRASKHCDGINASFIFFCIPYFLVHAFARNVEWVHNRMALSATLRLIKRKQIDEAPGNKIPWVDSRGDNVEEEALKVKVLVLSYASSWCLDDSFPHKLSEMVPDQKTLEKQTEIVHFSKTYRKRDIL